MTSQEQRALNIADEQLPIPSPSVPQNSDGGSTKPSSGIRLAGVLAGMGSGIYIPVLQDHKPYIIHLESFQLAFG